MGGYINPYTSCFHSLVQGFPSIKGKYFPDWLPEGWLFSQKKVRRKSKKELYQSERQGKQWMRNREGEERAVLTEDASGLGMRETLKGRGLKAKRLWKAEVRALQREVCAGSKRHERSLMTFGGCTDFLKLTLHSNLTTLGCHLDSIHNTIYGYSLFSVENEILKSKI